MLSKSFLSAFVSGALFAAFAFTVTSHAQTTAEKSGSVASYVRDLGEESGLVRPRVAPEAAKSTVKSATNELLELEREAFDQINEKRAEIGVGPIRWSDEVAKIARAHSENMATFNFFSHRGRDGKMVDDRADSFGMSRWTALGENIAFNRGFADPIAVAVEKWMESPSHRENLLNGRWKESGIGIAVAPNGTYYLTQVFMTRK
jgi:uncharacterized protein YkwD